MLCCRVKTEVWDQDLNASFAHATADSISSCVALGTLDMTSLVAYYKINIVEYNA